MRRRKIRSIVAVFVTAASIIVPAAASDEILLTGGDRLVGEIIERTGDVVVLSHPVLGRLEVPVGAIVRIVSDDKDDDRKPGDPVVPSPAAPDAPPPPAPPAWTSRFRLGAGGSFGNTDTQTFNADATATRKRDDARTTLDAAYRFGSSDGDRTDNRFSAGIEHDWLRPDSRWFSFASARYDFDEFQSWEHRFGGHAGLGYEVWDTERLSLILRAGGGVVQELGSRDEDLRPEGLLGADLAWQMSARQSLEVGTRFHPDLADAPEFRTVSSISWSWLVNDEAKMSLHTGVEHEYQSVVDPGKDHNDWRIIAGLQFDF